MGEVWHQYCVSRRNYMIVKSHVAYHNNIDKIVMPMYLVQTFMLSTTL